MADMTETKKVGDRELTLTRHFDAPPAKVYRAWREPELLSRWFCPRPWRIEVQTFEFHSGGRFHAVMRGPDGEEHPMKGVFLEVVPNRRIVLTDAFARAWEPTDKAFMAAVVELEERDGGTLYSARVLHWSEEDCVQHEQMGFHDGWSAAAEQLAEVVADLGDDTSTAAASDEAAVRSVIEALGRHVGRKDAAAIVALRAETYVQFSLAPPLVSDAADAAGLAAWFATWDGPIGIDMRELSITVGGDIACCHSLNHMTGRKIEGEVVDLWYRQTLCLRRIHGAWKIAHTHHSVPFYMDGSYRAAVDLRP